MKRILLTTILLISGVCIAGCEINTYDTYCVRRRPAACTPRSVVVYRRPAVYPHSVIIRPGRPQCQPRYRHGH